MGIERNAIFIGNWIWIRIGAVCHLPVCYIQPIYLSESEGKSDDQCEQAVKITGQSKLVVLVFEGQTRNRLNRSTGGHLILPSRCEGHNPSSIWSFQGLVLLGRSSRKLGGPCSTGIGHDWNYLQQIKHYSSLSTDVTKCEHRYLESIHNKKCKWKWNCFENIVLEEHQILFHK